MTVKSSYDIRRRQGLQLSGRQPRPPPLQTGINAKILKISPEWRRILIDEFFLYLFAEFELHPSNSFRENRCWSHKYSFLNMIGAKLSYQRNSSNASSSSSSSPFPFEENWAFIQAMQAVSNLPINGWLLAVFLLSRGKTVGNQALIGRFETACIAWIPLIAEARFKRRTFHVPNLMLLLSTWKVRRMNQLGSADLYSGRLYRSIRLGLPDRTAKDGLRFIRQSFQVPNLMHKLR